MKHTTHTASAKFLFLLILQALLLGGCAAHSPAVHKPVASTAQQETIAPQEAIAPEEDEDVFDLEDEFEAADVEPPVDPLSGYNRVMTQVNDKLYFWLLKPVSQGYSFVVPEGGRLAVGRFFNNLLMPVRFVNNLLQLKLKRAGTELARFGINTTVGVLGFGDPAAKSFDLQAYPEDFGQTLGHYGVGGGFHIVLPLLGPSNLRDTLGLIPDYYLDPVSYINDSKTELAVRAYRQVNHTSLHIGEYESLKKDAIDLYTFLRDGYEQRRIKQIEE
ncbi:MAG: VacJ family lipoprotein [Deltaproteobacteria bacterium]|nr:VacJ family lipoprotein [Deltaproteobacteria bacterium]